MNYLESELLKKENILLALPKNPKPELLASVLGLALALETLQKKVSVIAEEPYKKYPFLSSPKNISPEVKNAGDVFVSIDTKGRKVQDLRYEKLENEIRIHLGSEAKDIQKKHVSVKFSKTPFELIVIFGVKNKEDLGAFYRENKEIFSESESIIINKENYPEFVFDLLSDLKLEITRPIATNLLAGIMTESSGLTNFKDCRSFRLVSHLLKMNADYRQIASFFYKDKSQTDIKASRLVLKNSFYFKDNIFFSKIPNYELNKSGLSSNQIISAIIKQNELISEKTSLLVFLEPPKEKLAQFGIICVFTSLNKNTLLKFSRIFKATPKQNSLLFSVKAESLKEAENKIAKFIK